MASLFQKKTPIYPEESRWTILKGQNQGRTMFVRRNDSAKQLIGHPDYVYRAGIAIPLLKPNSDGLPTNEEMEVLNSIEDVLVEEVEKGKESLLVLVVTTSGVREFVCYTKSPEAVKKVVGILQTKFDTHKVQSYVKEDPKWEIYKEF